MQYLKKLYPKSLWGQLISLLILALISAQLISLYLFVDFNKIAESRVSKNDLIEATSESILLYETADLRSFKKLIRDKNRRNLKFRITDKAVKIEHKHSDIIDEIREKLDEKGARENYLIQAGTFQPKRKNFHKSRLPAFALISVQLEPNLWLIISHVKPKPPLNFIAPLATTLILMIIFIVVIVSLWMRKLTKPLSKLSKAAKDLGEGRQVEPLEEVGAKDLKDVTHSFNEMNKKVNKFVDDRTKMLGAISHDLRTPLTALRLRAEFIDDDEMRDKILSHVEEMQMMTEAALNFTKNSSFKEEDKESDLVSLIDLIVNDYQDMERDVSLNPDRLNDKMIATIRVQSFKRALGNLIDNGLKYGERVEIDLLSSKHHVEVWIDDFGPGLDQEEMDQVFEPFYRVEKSRNKDTGGVGLGLSITKDIILSHGGEIKLQNRKDGDEVQGLRVIVRLPV